MLGAVIRLTKPRRLWHICSFSSVNPDCIDKSKPVNVIVNMPASGDRLMFTGYSGESLQSIAEREATLQLHIPCSCGGNAACSTCHVYVDSCFYDKMPGPEEEELDMLDMAWGYQQGRSRLGCCLRLSEEIDGLTVQLPEQMNNLF